MKRTGDDIAQAYYTLRKAIAASCKAYDRGEKWEALRLATAVYTMVHDGGQMKSILSQGGVKTAEKFAFVSSGDPITDGDMEKYGRKTPLIEFERNKRGKGDFVPLCHHLEKRANFHEFRLMMFPEWWDKEIIAFDTKTGPTVYLDLNGGRIPKKPKSKAVQKVFEKSKQQMNELKKEIRDDGIELDTKTKITRKQLVFALRNQEGGSHFDPEIRNPNYIAFLRPVFMFSYPTLNVCKNLELAMMRQIAEEVRLSLMVNGAKSINGDLPQVWHGVRTKEGKCYPMSFLPKLLKDAETPS